MGDNYNNILDIFADDKSILIIGPYPPPLGGVSVHVKRLFLLLKKNDFNVSVFNTARRSKFWGQNYFKLLITLLFQNFDVIHLHNYNYKVLLVIKFVKLLKKFKLRVTAHNSRLLELEAASRKNFYKNIIKHLDCLIVVGKHILNEYERNDVKLPANTLVRNGFIPPPLDEEESILKTYSQQTMLFLNSHDPVIVANAFEISFCNNIDLYGIDMCVDLTSRLKKDFPNIGFLFALANENKHINYLVRIKKRIHEMEISDNFYFMTDQKELWPLFKRVDLMLRPTYTDGYGISVAEALYFNCPAIASNVCIRPEGTILVKNRDKDDLYEKTRTNLLLRSYKK